VFTDKLVAKIPSTASGTVKTINFKGEDVCAVGHTLMTIELEDGVEAEVQAPKHAQTASQAVAP
jgi:pyruvate/2-oxoglutarate dehydrogenase complex dihydrolipoamide acyltransferase (E2) component